MKELLPYLERRTAITADEAESTRQTLAEDPLARRWLADQLQVDHLLSRLLQPERADFVNRIHSTRKRSTDGEHFIMRTLAAQRAHQSGKPAARSRSMPSRPTRTHRHQRGLIAVAAAAALVVLIGGILLWTSDRVITHEVIEGQILVGDQQVKQIPDGAGFTVTGDDAAVVRLTGGTNARFSPSSAVTIHAQPHAETPMVRMTHGSGEFHVDERQQPLRVETGIGTITSGGADASFSADLRGAPDDPAPPTMVNDPGANPPANRSGTLAVAVRSGTANVDFHGRKHLIAADEVRIFSLADDLVTSARVLRGPLKSVTPHGPGASIAMTGKDGLRTILIGAQTRVRINDADASPAALMIGDHVEVHMVDTHGTADAASGATGTTPVLATLILAKRPPAKRPDPAAHHTP